MLSQVFDIYRFSTDKNQYVLQKFFGAKTLTRAVYPQLRSNTQMTPKFSGGKLLENLSKNGFYYRKTLVLF